MLKKIESLNRNTRIIITVGLYIADIIFLIVFDAISESNNILYSLVGILAFIFFVLAIVSTDINYKLGNREKLRLQQKELLRNKEKEKEIERKEKKDKYNRILNKYISFHTKDNELINNNCSLLQLIVELKNVNLFFEEYRNIDIEIDPKYFSFKNFLEKEISNTGNKLSFIAVDTETTGLRPLTDRIIQLSAVKFKDGIIVDEFNTLVNPKKKISVAASEVNGIYNDQVEDSPTIKEVLPSFLNFIGSETLVFHNARFDLSFLNRDILKLTGNELTNKVDDTMKIWRNKYFKIFGNKVPSAKLEYIVENILTNENLHEYNNGKHDSLYDARATGKVYLILK